MEDASAIPVAGEPAQPVKIEALKEIIDGNKHPLVEYMSDPKTRFFIVRAPCDAFLQLAVRGNEWAVSKKVADKIALNNSSNEQQLSQPPSIVLIVSLANSNAFQGVFTL